MDDDTKDVLTECPLIPKDLLEYLEKQYPERCPDPYEDERGTRHYAGAVSLVRWLRMIHNDQNENIMLDHLRHSI